MRASTQRDCSQPKSSIIYSVGGDKEGFAVEGKHTEIYMTESPVIYLVGNEESFAVFESKHTEVYMAKSSIIRKASS